jgi:hypothetical protein
MRTAGMFAELGPVKQAEPQPSIFDNRLDEPLPDVDRVVAYLRGGHKLMAFMDVADDVFDSSKQVMNGSSILTDGDWMWRNDIAYYVERHNVTPPPEMLELIRQRHYIVPDVPDDVLDALVEPAIQLMS